MRKSRILPITGPEHVEEVIATLQAGGLVAIPTDTVYGLAALPPPAGALRRLLALKGAQAGPMVALLLADLEALPRFAECPPAVHPLAERFWPGPLTMLLPRTDLVPAEIGEGGSIGLRIPNSPLARDLIRAAGGALAVPRANRPGRPVGRNAQEVLAELDGDVDLVVEGGPPPAGLVSPVVDCTRWPPVVLREGAILEVEILKALGLTRARK